MIPLMKSVMWRRQMFTDELMIQFSFRLLWVSLADSLPSFLASSLSDYTRNARDRWPNEKQLACKYATKGCNFYNNWWWIPNICSLQLFKFEDLHWRLDVGFLNACQCGTFVLFDFKENVPKISELKSTFYYLFLWNKHISVHCQCSY